MNFELIETSLTNKLVDGQGLDHGAIFIAGARYNELTVLDAGNVLSFVDAGEEGTPDLLVNGDYLHGFSDSDQVETWSLDNGVVVFRQDGGYDCTYIYITDDLKKLSFVIQAAISFDLDGVIGSLDLLKTLGFSDEETIEFLVEEVRQQALSHLRASSGFQSP